MDEPRCLAMITPAAYSRVFHGSADQLTRVRRDVRDYLDGCLVDDDTADDAVLIASEFGANAILHSASKGAFIIVRAEVRSSYVVVEVEDLGGPWHCRPRDATRPHGLDLVTALVGPDNWGVDGDAGGRVTWARIDLEGHGHG